MTTLTLDMKVRRGSFVVAAHLEVAGGETLALLGPNGAGKSSLVAAVGGLLPIDEGRISLGSRELANTRSGVDLPPEERHIGIVHQDHLLFPHLTVLANVAFGPRSQGLGRAAADSVAHKWLDHVGLGTLGDRLPSQLSGGQAQRVALARALASDPDALLLDEPLAALDVTSRSETRRLLMSHLEAFSGPKILITHEPTEAFLMASRVAIIEGGHVVQVGAPDDIRRRPRTPYAADLAGINLVRGVASDGTVTTETGDPVTIADTGVSGPVLLTIHPRTVVFSSARPEGSARNVWKVTVTAVEPMGDRVRIATSGPVPLTAEITASSAHRLGLERGSQAWIAVKATEISVEKE